MTILEQATQLAALPPRSRAAEIAAALTSAHRAGADLARDWHRKQADVFRAMSETVRVDKSSAKKAALFAAHHDACANQMPWRN